MTKKKIGLVGYFGWGNFGDELFLEAHKQHLGRDFDLEVVHDLFVSPYFSRPIDKVVERYDAFLIGGGDLINPVRVSELYWQAAYLKKPVFVFGIGVPSTKKQNEGAIATYRKFFQHPNCKLVVPRDPESMNWLAKVLQPTGRMEWHPDAVCAWRRPEAPARPTTSKTLGVVMRSHRSLADDLSAVRTMIDHAKTLDYSVKHIVLGTGTIGAADVEIARQIAQPDEPVITSESLEKLSLEIASCNMLASIKFHGMVVATMYGIPSIAMSVTPKNRNFLRQIERQEMISGYQKPDLWKRLSHYPAPIHQVVRARLFRGAKLGYQLLKDTMHEHLS